MSKPNIEQLLSEMMTEPTPDARFVAELERELLAAEPASPTFWKWVMATFFAPRRVGTTVVFALLVAMLLPVAIIGPRTVVGQIQSWVGYVPGVGFVDLDASQRLTESISVEQEGVTLTVLEVIATDDETSLQYRYDGVETVIVGPAIPNSILRLADGTELEQREFYMEEKNKGRFVFPPLPDGVQTVTWELPFLPGVPILAEPHDWVVPIVIEKVEESEIGDRYAAPYRLEGVEDTQQGVTVRVVEVAHSAENTALRIQVDWDDPNLRNHWLLTYPTGRKLSDNLGYVYQQTHDSIGSTVQQLIVPEEESIPKPTPDPTLLEVTETYTALSSQAEQLTLTLDGIIFDVTTNGSFVIDLGENPQIGDYFPLDIDLILDGFPVHFSGATLTNPSFPNVNAELLFEVDPVPEMNNRLLQNVTTFSERVGNGGGGSSRNDDGTLTLHPSITFRSDREIPTGKLTITLPDIGIVLMSEWVITWDVP